MSPQQVADAVCERCEGRGWVVEADGGPGTAAACPCQEESVIPRLLGVAGIPERYRRCSFDNFHVGDIDEGRSQQLLQARTLASRYVDDFLTDEGRFLDHGLLFAGPTGVGKTHLAAAVLSELIRRYRLRAMFTDCTALIHRLQSTFDPGSPRSKRDVLDPILGADLLVLDDLGAQKSSDWVDELLYLILNERYSSQSPTLVTTNYLRSATVAPGEGAGDIPSGPWGGAAAQAPLHRGLKPNLVSRLHEMTRIVRIEAGDYRQEMNWSH